jgi:hypothetical protein
MCFISHFTRSWCRDWITWERAGPLGGKRRTISWEGRRVWCESWHLQDYSPCLCQLRTDGLAPASKYWMYQSHVGDIGPVSLVASRQQKVGFAPTFSMAILREKLSTDPRIGQPVCCGLCRKPFFLGVVARLNSVDDYIKGCYALTAWDTYGLGPYMDWVWDACGVLDRFSL